MPQVVILSFACTILTGAFLLLLPFSHTRPTSFIDALFTSTSAVCVTGLITVDTAKHWTTIGQVIIMLLIQVGGLGVMTFSAIGVILMGGQLSHRMGLILKEALNQLSMKGIGYVVKYILIMTFAIEGAGFILLTIRWSRDFPFGQACWYGLFHTVSAFCNAGFSLFSDNLTQWRDDLFINGAIAGLLIIGGIGFTVLLEIREFPHTRKLSTHSKLALSITALLLVGGTILILVFETFRPPYSYEHYNFFDKLITSFFQSASARTAGFNTIDVGAMSEASLFALILLMFIGASPGGTGGGIKTTTFGALAASLIAIARGNPDVTVFKRRLAPDLLLRAFTIALLSISLVSLVALIMTAIEGGKNHLKVLFEVTSAFGTVGLSTGITPYLTTAEKYIIVITMYAGRVGPLTLAIALAERAKKSRVKYPDGNILIG